MSNTEPSSSSSSTTPNRPQTALVTGGSRGLGRNTVLALARRGVDSIFTYHSHRDAADQVVREVADLGQRAIALPLDTGRLEQFDAFVEQVRGALQQLGREHLHYLVNNAGTSHHAPFEQTTEDALDQLYRVHFKGVFFLTQKLLPLIQDGGHIVMVSSALTRLTYPGSVSYASMKTAVETLSRYLAKELGPRRIAVNTVAPGAMETDFSEGRVRDNPELNQFIAGATALGRAGVPDDVGPMIASLLSQDHRWVNGQRIEVSGGMAL